MQKDKVWGHIYDRTSRGVIVGKDTKLDRDGKTAETGLPIVSWDKKPGIVCLNEELVDLNPPPPRVFRDRDDR